MSDHTWWRLRPTWIWLPIAPALPWLIGALYLPVLAPALPDGPRWLTALALTLLSALSLAAHGLGHALMARGLGAELPERIPLGPLGDPAQIWPPAEQPAREALVALAGPGASLLIAGLAGLVWRAQVTPGLDAAALFVALFNAGLAALNLAPGYPLDGGRLLALALGGVARRPARVGRIAGAALVAGLLIWAAAIVATRSRLSGAAAGGLAGLAALLLIGLTRPASPAPGPSPREREGSDPAASIDRPPAPARGSGGRGVRAFGAAALGLLLLGPSLALLPLPFGLYAPGGAVAVAPMIDVPGRPPAPTRGALLLTTVIEQTPIVVAQWLDGQVNPAITLLPPEQVVPPGSTPQELVAISADQLAASQLTATVVALRRAGYAATITGDGARVLGLQDASPARGLLRPGDVITSLGGESVRSVDDLLAALGGQAGQDQAAATIERDGQARQLTLPLAPPASDGGPPRIGISVETAGMRVESPVDVQIHTQSIIGGPSAGLMFTLAIYDRLTPGDLTGGRVIAGTGTISLDGAVGPIGGVAQKVAAAERAGATIFLVPRENAAEAERVARKIRVIPVGTLDEALAALR